MANFGSSLKRSFTPPRLMRPAQPVRTLSGSSAGSCASPSSMAEDQFVFSVGNTPVRESPPSHIASSSHASTLRDGLLYGKDVNNRSQFPGTVSVPADPPNHIRRSRPIAIELPSARKPRTAPVETPPEPLSARGDIQGGYFPEHEDPASRIRKPHPFHLEVNKLRPSNLHHASEPPAEMAASLSRSRGFPAMSGPSQFSLGNSVGYTTSASGSHTPVSSYIPIGVHDNMALPMGKYYPSNYEKNGNRSPPRLRPSGIVNNPAAAVKSESQVPKLRREHTHTRTGSEVQRRLQQYQRDMIAQATIAASALLENSGTDSSAALPGSSTAATFRAKAPVGFSLKNIELGSTLIRSHKPISPRLAPLASPGPITPMQLDGNGGDSYLTLGRPMTGADAEQQSAELARAVRAAEGRQPLKETMSAPVL